MATQLQSRRGTTAEHGSFTGVVGEVTVDTDKDVVVVHDGATAGGHPSVKGSLVVTAAVAIDANAVVIGDDGAKGVKKSVVLISDAGIVTGATLKQ
ncbi:MAG: hypothetical protein Q7J85_05465, partial [Bacillota bacterium]|nr:hypothetical protein [Bacillota bacterium]